MLSTIPNPKKSVQVDFPIDKIAKSVKNLSLMDKAYKFSSANENFNQYTYESTEFLSAGVYIDFHLNAITENKTEISVEIRRKIGAFDQSHEITQANTHMTNIFNYISNLSSLSDTQIAELEATQKYKKPKNTGYNWLIVTGLCVLFGFTGAHRFYTKQFSTGLFQFLSLGGFGAWWLYDTVMLLTMKFKDGDGNLIER